MPRVLFRPAAVSDLRQIAEYIETDRPGRGYSFVVQNRRQRYALLLSQGGERWDLRWILAAQLLVITGGATILSWGMLLFVLWMLGIRLDQQIAAWGLNIAGLDTASVLPLFRSRILVIVGLALPTAVCAMAVLVAWGALRAQGFRRGQALAHHLFGE